MATPRSARTYDVVLYGATGFVGQQTVAYFARHPQVQALGLKWALAGRSADKLKTVQKACGASQAGIVVADPYLLNPPGQRPANGPDAADPKGPRHDPDFAAWLGPFFMGPVNTRVVRRSAALLNYPADFSYQEYLRLGRGPAAALAATSLSVGSAVSQAALRVGVLRNLAQRFAPPPGAGPSEESMDKGSFRCQWMGHSASGKSVRGLIADQGDPGNRATTKMLCESALALALQLDALPGGTRHGGVLTPASGLGEVLVQRLRVAGMTLQATPTPD